MRKSGGALSHLQITAKIWLVIAIFAIGLLGLLAKAHVELIDSERYLGTVSEALFPAARAAQDANAAFQRVVKAFSEAVLMDDQPRLAIARAEGDRVVSALRRISVATDLPESQRAEAGRLAGAVGRFVAEASETYASLPPVRAGMSDGLQKKVRGLGQRTAILKVEIEALDVQLTGSLRNGLSELRKGSARMRAQSAAFMVVTLILTIVLMKVLIRRFIVAPLVEAQDELAHERDLLQSLLDHVPDSIYFKDAESRFIRINNTHAGLLGVEDAAQAYGHRDGDFFDSSAAKEAQEDERRIIATGQAMISKVERFTRPGMSRWVMTTKAPVKGRDGKVHLIVGVSRDITDWKEAIESLERSEASFRLLFAAIPQAVWVCDLATYRFLEVNEAAVRQYGYSFDEFRRITLLDVYPEWDHERLKHTLGTLDRKNLPCGARKHLTKTGSVLDVEITTHMLTHMGRDAILITAHDITDRKRLELELQHAQRLEAVGQLASGIAHEINTPIQYIGDNIRFLLDAFIARRSALLRYEELRRAAIAGAVTPALLEELAQVLVSNDMDYLNEEIPRALNQSAEGVERVATIVRAMKSFAHPGHKEKAAADLNKALIDAVIVARNTIKYVADVDMDLCEDLPPVVCHIGDINQVLLNLLVNAADAIREANQGTEQLGRITVKTQHRDGQAVISIGDTGCGIPPEIQSKVFDLFFTTKEVGRGTGQGLAIARSIIVEKHGGRITFEPNPDRGTTFTVCLPIDPDHKEEEEAEPKRLDSAA